MKQMRTESVMLYAIKYGTTNLNISFAKRLSNPHRLEFRKGRDSAAKYRTKANPAQRYLLLVSSATRIVKHVESIIAYTLMYHYIECLRKDCMGFLVLKGSEKFIKF